MKKLIYDFDKTIYDGDSTLDFYLFCLKKKKSILKYFFKQVFYYILYKMNLVPKKKMKEIFFIFLNDFENIDKIIKEFWNKNINKIKPWYLKRNHKDDIIISASPEFLLKIPAKKLEVFDLIASDVDSKTGTFRKENCYGQEKVKMLKSKYNNISITESYSDSYSDLPILQLASRGYIVKKNKIVEYKSNKEKKDKLKNFILYLILLFSLISFSTLMNFSCCKNLEMVKISSIVTILSAIILFIYLKKKQFLEKTKEIKQNYIKFISLFLTLCYAFKTYKFIGNLKIINKFLKLIGLKKILILFIVILSVFFVYKVVIFILNKLCEFWKEEVKLADLKEKRFYLISFFIFTFIIIIWYTLANKAVIRDDLFFSIDSNYVAIRMFPDLLWHLDFRHIFFSFLTFPFYWVFRVLREILPLTNCHYYMFIAILNTNLLIMTAIMLKRILKDDKFMYFYLLSFPTILFGIVIEKFQLCVFLIVLFIYIRNKQKENKFMEDFALICSVGAITTSAFLGIWSNRCKLLEKIKQWLIVAFKFIIISIVLGKYNILMMVFNYIKTFGKLPILERFYGVTELLASCLFAPLIKVSNGRFLWQNTAKYLNILGVLILIACLITFIRHRKEKIFQICFSWLIFMFILFIGLNWYCYEAPLFNLYFSWAILIFVFQFIKDIFYKYKYYNQLWMIIFSFMLAINSSLMIKLLVFLI